WIGTESAGTVMMKNGRIVTFPELALGGKERRLLAACEDAEGGVWLYHANGDLWRYHKQRLTPLLFAPSDASQPRSIIKENGGPVWLGTNRRQYAVEAAGEVGSATLRVN